ISYMTRFFTLEPGDVVLTGTPQGVGPLTPGDRLVVELADLIRL
ncbi:MAG TPA: isomerase/hydrolase, partial [Porticoccaceae bacterium]|nr:isomerase/hydrolase [Porticoccaceae bacterium]